MGDRRWRTFGPRILNELNGVSGLSGVGGTAIGIAGGTAAPGLVGSALMATGGFIVIGALGYAVFRGVPPETRHPQDVLGQRLKLEDLEEIYPPPDLRLAIVGAEHTGKTTLKKRLQLLPKAAERTQQITAHVIALQTAPQRFIAVLDGGGEKLSQQFRISNFADAICLIVDHNYSPVEKDVDERRLTQHANLLSQIRHELAECSNNNKQVILLANKRDLWEDDTTTKSRVHEFCSNEVDKWLDRFSSNLVMWRHHSNEDADDIASLVKMITDWTANEED